MQSAFHPAFGTRVPYTFVSLPESPDGQVRETIKEIIRLIRTDCFSQLIQEDAQECLKLGQGNPILGAWEWREKLKFQNDDKTAGQLESDDPRVPDTIEVLIRPVDQSQLIRLKNLGMEDCDGYSMYLGCILTALGVPVSLVTVAANPEVPEQYSHVYLAAYPEGPHGVRVALDFSHGKHIGWECPNTGRIREWPVWVTLGEKLSSAFPVAVFAGAFLAARYFNRRAA